MVFPSPGIPSSRTCPDEQAEPVPEEIFERLSREEKSTLNYEDIQSPGSYAEESAMERDSVPWRASRSMQPTL